MNYKDILAEYEIYASNSDELLEYLPEWIDPKGYNCDYSGEFFLEICKDSSRGYNVYLIRYGRDKHNIKNVWDKPEREIFHATFQKNLYDSCAEMVIFLIEKDVILNRKRKIRMIKMIKNGNI